MFGRHSGNVRQVRHTSESIEAPVSRVFCLQKATSDSQIHRWEDLTRQNVVADTVNHMKVESIFV